MMMKGVANLMLLNGQSLQIDHFPNGELRVSPEILEQLVTAKDQMQLLTLRFETNEDLVVLLLLSQWLREEGFKSQALYMPYMPYSRMDRKVGRHLFSLQYITSFINAMHFEKVYVLEAHSQVTLALIDNVISLSYVNKLVQLAMNDMGFDEQLDVIVFPDKGAEERYRGAFPSNFRILYGEKIRDFDTGEVLELNVKGDGKAIRKALSVDDLVSRGTTFLQLAKACEALGIHDISLAVTHTENNLYSGTFFHHITRLYTTDALQPFLEQALVHPQITVYALPDINELYN